MNPQQKALIEITLIEYAIKHQEEILKSSEDKTDILWLQIIKELDLDLEPICFYFTYNKNK